MRNKAFQEQVKHFDAHRQFHRLHFKANDMDFFFQWVMGSAVHGGAGIGEGFYAASRMKDGDPGSWAREWTALAERIHMRAENALNAGHIVSAREAFLRATVYYRAALSSMLPEEPAFCPTIARFRGTFLNAAKLFDPPVERIEVSFAGSTLPGYFQKAQLSSEPRPTLLMIGGGETFTEDLYFFIAPAALKRGYNFATIDLPGQGDLPLHGQYFRADYETPMKAVLDTLLDREDVDGERLAVYGISAGGYIVPRAAAYEKRIKACIANSMIFDMFQLFQHSNIPKLKGLVKWIAERKAPFQMRMLRLLTWRWGLRPGHFAAWIEKNRDLVFDPGLITCPTLLLCGEGEIANPEIRRQQETALQRMTNPLNKLIIGPADEGAASHCFGENLSLMSAFVFDWLDEVFA